MVQLTYHGHSVFEVQGGGKRLIIDPFLNNNGLCGIKPDDVQVDYILITHGHGDHVGDALEIAKRCNATIVAAFELAMYLGGKGANVHPLHIGGGHDFDFGRVQMTVAHHGSGYDPGDGGPMIYMGDPGGFLLTIEGKKIYHTGDTGLVAEMGLLGDMHEIDALMLPIGGNFTMGMDDALYAATKLIKPKLTIPMHYNTFPVIPADPGEFVLRLSKAGFAGKVLQPGETLEIA